MAVSDGEYLRTLQRQTEESLDFLTKQENQGDREKSVVAAFLRCVRVHFVLNELQPGSDPPDVIYRGAAFEVTEVLDQNRRRGDEWEDKLQKQREAASLSDLKEPYRPPEHISMSELVQLTSESLAKKQQRYGTGTCKELDALVYVDLKDRLLNQQENAPSLNPLATQGWRSVSFLMPPHAGTLYAASSAPDFLSQGKILSVSV